VIALLLALLLQDPADLIRRLGSEDADERERATAALEKAGPAALPELRKALATSDPEVASRVRTLVSRIERAERVRAAVPESRRLTLKAGDVKVRDLLKSVTDQTGYTVRLGDDLEDRMLDNVEIADATALEAIDSIARRFPEARPSITLTGKEGEIHTGGHGIHRGWRQARGPVLIILAANGKNSFAIGAWIEPGHAAARSVEVEIAELRNADGDDVKGRLAGTSVAMEPDDDALFCDWSGLPNVASRLKVRVHVRYVLEERALRIQPGVEARTEDHEGVRFTLAVRRSEAGGCEMEIKAKAAEETERSHRTLAHFQASVIKALKSDGAEIPGRVSCNSGPGYQGSDPRPSYGITLALSDAKPDEVAAAEFNLVTDDEVRTYDFEFTDLRLVRE
jgi:hypothetical protein